MVLAVALVNACHCVLTYKSIVDSCPLLICLEVVAKNGFIVITVRGKSEGPVESFKHVLDHKLNDENANPFEHE
jgi:hypothetical protein